MKPQPQPQFLEVQGYPADETEAVITAWPHQDFVGLINFISEYFNRNGRIWEAELEEHSDPIRVVNLATGGWSGNEQIIYAMQQNHVCCGTRWLSSHSGGKHVFELMGDETIE